MKGGCLAIGIIGLIEYYYYLIIKDVYHPYNMYGAGVIAIIFFWLSFQQTQSKQMGDKK